MSRVPALMATSGIKIDDLDPQRELPVGEWVLWPPGNRNTVASVEMTNHALHVSFPGDPFPRCRSQRLLLA